MGKVPLFPVRNANGSPVADCWTTVDQYRVALCRLERLKWTVTRPGENAPFLYTGSESDVHLQILADRKASEASA